MPSNFDPPKHHRQSICLKGYDYSQAGAYFVTVVTKNPMAFFGQIVDDEVVLNEAGRWWLRHGKSWLKDFPT
ncbi:MAG: hypothetical protein L6461_20950 [Anaerolineae bacterium]|nr:hypothetical protein [Anaerolineae bacterium]